MPDSTGAGNVPSESEVAKLQQEMLAKRGYTFGELSWLARQDPAYEKARLEYSALIYTRDNPVLPMKYREMIASVVLGFRGYPSIAPHLRRALREGATMQELLEAFEVATVPGGMPVLHFVLPYLIEIDKEMQAKGS